ncbi:MAG: vitamin K epoxide reductase family protein [Chloroflexota bacterium]|nr:vitamin K epoxide reductase family protein [Chloroflexota bacterium]
MRWIWLSLPLLGLWLTISPFLLDYAATPPPDVARVAQLRGLPPAEVRAGWATWNDVIVGLLVAVLGLLSASPRRIWAPWAVALAGVWLLFAPFALWTPSPADHLNDTLVGILLISLTVLVPGMPGMPLIMKMGAEVPPGWSYNPSSWLQRTPVIALGWLGFFISRYMGAYQLGHIDAVWDPFFGAGTERILDSHISLMWPISDAGLGSVIYAGEALMGYMGSTMRWRTMPWMVAFFGIAVIPLGLVSIALVIMQPVAVGTWCTLCLVTAAAMLVMMPLAVDEVVAMLQFLGHNVRAGANLWRSFFLGYGIEGEADERTPDYGGPLRSTIPASAWGVTLPRGLLLAAVAGTWLLFAPELLATTAALANSNHLSGALAASIAVIVLAEPIRLGRWLNLPVAAWVAVSAVLLGGGPIDIAHNVFVGLLIAAGSIPRGSIRQRFGDWQRLVR